MSKETKELTEYEEAYLYFTLVPTGDTCQWWGTEWEDDPKSKSGQRLKPCGAPTIGTGLFTDPTMKFNSVLDVCERHVGTMPWYGKELME